MPHVATRLLTAGLPGLMAFASFAADTTIDRAISEILDGFVKPGEPGCTVGVTENGALQHALAFGMSDVERAKPLDTHSTIDLGSVSKQFTAFALLLLQQRGRLSGRGSGARHLPDCRPGRACSRGRGASLRPSHRTREREPGPSSRPGARGPA